MDELPGNPYYFDGSDEYWELRDKISKAYYDGLKLGKDIYTRKRESIGECPICYDDIDQGYITTNCGHTLCLDCFENTIKSVNSNCPMCRSTMITGITSSTEVNRLVKEGYGNGWSDGYEEGSEIVGDLAQQEIDMIKMKLGFMRNKYKKLKKIYDGTIIQLNSTHTLNFKQKKMEGSIVRTSSV
jgi:hypothetical protein